MDSICLLAFDIMVNEDGQLFILEVNRGPGGIEQGTAGMSTKFRSGMRQMIREIAILTAAENMRGNDEGALGDAFLCSKKVSGFMSFLAPNGNCVDSDRNC